MLKSNIVFNLLTPETIARLKRDGKVKVPEKKLSIPKDERWNEKYLNIQIIRGLETGESIDEIADRMFPEMLGRTPLQGKSEKEVAGLVKRNIDSAIRNARTMVTSAENRGRLDSYENLSDQGVVMKKQWIATPDDRTRPSHIDIDGEEQDVDEPFSNGCMFPGDGNGPSEEVWMCRCAMGTHIVGFRRADGSISHVDYEPDDTLHEEQMKEERERRK